MCSRLSRLAVCGAQTAVASRTTTSSAVSDQYKPGATRQIPSRCALPRKREVPPARPHPATATFTPAPATVS